MNSSELSNSHKAQDPIQIYFFLVVWVSAFAKTPGWYFQGNNIHCGAHPHEGPLSDQLIRGVTKCWSYVGCTNRCAYVNYPNNVATQWTVAIAMNQPTGWGNSSIHDNQEMNQKTFLDNDSIVLGNLSETKNRLA